MIKEYEKVLDLDLKNDSKLDKVANALSNKTRRKILSLLASGPRTINNISFELDTPLSTISEQISILIKAGIISVLDQSIDGKKGKVVSRQYEKINISICDKDSSYYKNHHTLEIPIGSYFAFNVDSFCGMLCEDGYIGERDNSNVFFSSDRFKAQLIWFNHGYLEYVFPINRSFLKSVSSLNASLELCSEAPGYIDNWKSDIFFEINDHDVGTFISPGDFGGRQGLLTPSWWPQTSTQYGLLVTIEVKDNGSFINGEKASDTNLESLLLDKQDFIKFKVGVKENAKNRGGINIFGKKFGDYPQDIVLTISSK